MSIETDTSGKAPLHNASEGRELIRLFLQIKSQKDKDALIAYAKKMVGQQGQQ